MISEVLNCILSCSAKSAFAKKIHDRAGTQLDFFWLRGIEEFPLSKNSEFNQLKTKL